MSRIPVQVVGKGGSGTLHNIKEGAAGENHTIALKDDGTVWAWGSNLTGELGTGSEGYESERDKNIPVILDE